MKELLIFRSTSDGFLYYSIDGNIAPLELFQDNIFKIPNGIYQLKNNTEYRLVPIKTTDGYPTYRLEQPIVAVGSSGGRGRRGADGAPGLSTQLAVKVTGDEATGVLTAVVTGGTASTYLWEVSSFTNVSGEDEISFTGVTNASTVQLQMNPNQIAQGMARVTVTDTLGRIAYGYFDAHIEPVA